MLTVQTWRDESQLDILIALSSANHQQACSKGRGREGCDPSIPDPSIPRRRVTPFIIAMRDRARDTDVKLKGLRICARGGRIARERARRG